MGEALRPCGMMSDAIGCVRSQGAGLGRTIAEARGPLGESHHRKALVEYVVRNMGYVAAGAAPAWRYELMPAHQAMSRMSAMAVPRRAA